MTTRRGFLGALLSLAAAPVLKNIPLISGERALVLQPTAIVGMPLVGELTMIQVTGYAPTHRAGGARLLRAGHTLLDFCINEINGSYGIWTASPGNEIALREDAPVVIDVSQFTDFTAYYRSGSRMQAFRRRGGLIEADESKLMENLCLSA